MDSKADEVPQRQPNEVNDDERASAPQAQNDVGPPAAGDPEIVKKSENEVSEEGEDREMSSLSEIVEESDNEGYEENLGMNAVPENVKDFEVVRTEEEEYRDMNFLLEILKKSENEETVGGQNQEMQHETADAINPAGDKKLRAEAGFTRRCVRLFKCSYCSKRFMCREVLAIHRQLHKQTAKKKAAQLAKKRSA